MLFADLVAVTGAVKDDEVRMDKVGTLSAFLRGLSSTEASLCVELLLRTQLHEGANDAESTSGPSRPITPSAQPSLDCEHVATTLAEIERAGAPAIRKAERDQLLAQATADEQRWILEAIDHLHLHRPTFDLLVTSAATGARVTVGRLRRAATLCGSLPLAVRIAFDRGESGLDAVAFEPGRPIPPTFAEGVTAPSALLEPGDPSLTEWNVVADRIQVHRMRNDIRVFDDDLTDVTELLPIVVDQVAALPRDDLVLDGWVDIDRRSGPDSTAVDGWTRQSAARRRRERAVFFDVLLDGAPMVDVPLSDRRSALEAIVPEDQRLPVLDVGNPDALCTAMTESIELGHDGFVVKPWDAPYEGGLTRSSWRIVEATHIVRLVVVAARRGTRGRSHLLSAVHLAALDDRGRPSEVAQTARGLSEQTVVQQTGHFARLMLDEPDDSSSRVFHLRPEVVAIVAIDGVDLAPANGEPTVRNPLILGYSEHPELGVTTVAELNDLHASGHPEQPADATEQEDPGPRDADQVPRLPDRGASTVPRLPDHPTGVRPADAVTVAPSVASRPQRGTTARRSVTDVEFEPYVEPVLTTSRSTRLGVIGARAAACTWVLVLLAVALTERSGTGPFDPGLVERLGRQGGAIVVLSLALTGWLWSDHLVRTLMQLDGRKPTRLRCATAWWSPVLVALALAALVVRMEPTSPADVRPAIIVVAFGFAMWRPYALLRRVLFSLTRLRSDSLIASGYILDVLTFGFLWWRLSLLDDRVSGGEVDILVGALGATVISMALSAAVWRSLLRAADDAVAHRRSSQRTRYEHRMLRLRGVDPTDPEVWWELVQRRADEEREAAATDEDAERAELPTVDALIESARREHTVAFRRLGEEDSSELEERLRTEFTAILGDAVDTPTPEHLDLPTDTGADTPERSPTSLTPDEPEVPGDDQAEQSTPTGRRQEDPIEAMRRRARGREETKTERSDFEQLISRAGSLQIDAALAAQRRKDRQTGPGERLLPPRLFVIEALRFVTATTLAVVTLATAWLVITSMSSEAAAGTDRLSASVIDDLELGRQFFWGFFTVGAALVPLWSHAIMRRARDAGVDGLRLRRVRVLAVIATIACAAGFVLDGSERGIVTLLVAVPIVWSAVSAGFCVEPVRTWFSLPSATLTACISTLPVIVGLAWLAGLVGSIEPTVSLQRLAFTTILLTLACVRVTVMFVLTSLDVEAAIRTSPQLALPARPRVRT